MSEIITDIEKLMTRADEVNVKVEKADVRKIIVDLKNTIMENDLRGLAANQIGYNKRIICIRYTNEIVAYINPVITEMKGFGFVTEDCASLPGKKYLRPRYGNITIAYQNKKGEIEAKQLVGLAAQTFQHEMDHLDGLLLSDIGLEIDDNFDKLTEEEKEELIEYYSKYLDKKQKEVQQEIDNNEDLHLMQDAVNFMVAVQKGEVQVEPNEPVQKET